MKNFVKICCVLSVILSTNVTAKTVKRKPARPRLKNSSKIQLKLSYDFSVTGQTEKIKLITALPKTIPSHQRIFSIEYSPEPIRIFTENGNDYAEFIFENPPEQFNLQINIKAKIFKYDLFTARKRQKIILPDEPDLNEFLKHEANIEKDHPLIQQMAAGIKKADNEAATVKNIFDMVIYNLKYVNDNKSSGALYAAKNKTGECSEYADLLVALCRAKGIPARTVSGYINHPAIVPRHAWAEVYLKKHGWVPFDPTWADVVVKSPKDFHILKPVYIYLNHTRNDPILHNFWYSAWSYIGDAPKVKTKVEFKQYPLI